MKFSLTAGQRHDITQAEFLTKGFTANFLLADKGYDSNMFIETSIAKGFTPVIPSKKNRTHLRNYDDFLYQNRYKIEYFFSKIKHSRMHHLY